MPRPDLDQLSRRERQIMDAIYRLGRATAGEVRQAMPDPPGYSAVRAQLRILEDKGFLSHEQEGPRYVFLPTVPATEARQSVLRGALQTFFEGSRAKLMASLLDSDVADVSSDELDALEALIDQARKEGR